MAKTTSMRNLVDLDLSYTNVGGKFAKTAAGKPPFRLRKLAMNCCPRVKDDTLGSLLVKCPNLVQLRVSGTNIKGKVFSDPRFAADRMKSLSLDFCSKLSPATIAELIKGKKFKQLKCLSAVGNTVQGFDEQFLLNIHETDPLLVIQISGDEDDFELARRRGLHITNWINTRQHLVKGMPFMLSPFWLQSLEYHQQ